MDYTRYTNSKEKAEYGTMLYVKNWRTFLHTITKPANTEMIGYV